MSIIICAQMHPLLNSCPRALVTYNYKHNYIIADMHSKEVKQMYRNFLTTNFYLVKIANSNATPTLQGFCWHPCFGAQA